MTPLTYWSLWISLAYFLAAITYPISLLVKLRGDTSEVIRWLKNTPTFTIYLPFVFSLGAGALLAFFPWDEFVHLCFPQLLLAIGLLVVFLGLAIFVALEDLKRPIVEPFMFRSHSDQLRQEKEIRGAIKDSCVASDVRVSLVKQYKAIAPPFQSLGCLRTDGSRTAIAACGLNILVAVTVAFLLWSLSLPILFNTITLPHHIIAVVIGIFCIWFPLRLYAEWYLHFYSLQDLKRYYAFGLISVAAIIGATFYVFHEGGGLAKVISYTVSGIMALIVILGKFKPQWLHIVADVVDEMPARWFAVYAILIVLSLMIMVGATIVTYSDRCVVNGAGRSSSQPHQRTTGERTKGPGTFSECLIICLFFFGSLAQPIVSHLSDG